MSFTPNWQRLKFKSGEEAMLHAIQALMSRRKTIVLKGLGEPVNLTYLGRSFILDYKAPKKKK